MGFLELAKIRYSVRNYCDKPVEREKLDRILEAGRVAPTASNGQPQRVIVVESKAGLQRLERGVNPYFAPLALIVCANRDESFHNPFDGKDSVDVDGAIVATHMMMEATELGLGTVWIGQFDPTVVRCEFGIPEHVEPVCILLVGYADCEAGPPDRHATTRKPITATVRYEKY